MQKVKALKNHWKLDRKFKKVKRSHLIWCDATDAWLCSGPSHLPIDVHSPRYHSQKCPEHEARVSEAWNPMLQSQKTYWAAHDTSSVFPTCDCNQGQSPESTDFRQSTLVFSIWRVNSNDLITFRNCAQVAPTRHGPSRCAASVSRHWQTPSRTPSWTKVWKFPIKSTNCLIWNVLKSHKISVYFLVSSGLIPT